MDEESISIPDKLLLTMHNMCIVRPDTAKNGEKLSNAIQEGFEATLRILKRFESIGYVKSLSGLDGRRRFYLTGMGILRVCSSFT